MSRATRADAPGASATVTLSALFRVARKRRIVERSSTPEAFVKTQFSLSNIGDSVAGKESFGPQVEATPATILSLKRQQRTGRHGTASVR